MSVKKILSLVASTIKFFIIIMLFAINSKAEDNNIKYYYEDSGILSLMYHRFDENKYPSTNIQMNIFKKQISIINSLNYNFYDPQQLQKDFNIAKNEKKILVTIDDAFSSFYKFAWPYLKKEKIPFILFVSTEAVGKTGYMSWEQIQEIEKESYAYIGNHSHSHNYLVDLEIENFLSDINASIKIFNQHLGYNPIFFSYPFGEYSKTIKDFISKNFDFAFGQHSGVIDINKDPHELPRFPINEKYGKIERFSTLLKTLPFKYKSVFPNEKYINDKTNPPRVKIEFFENFYNLKNLNCFSNENDKWRKSKINFNSKTNIEIILSGKFTTERGRINCSLREPNGFYRWLGMQFVVAEK